MRFDGGVINRWKDLTKGYKILPLHSQNKLDLKIYECPKFWGNKSPNFEIPILESWGKVTFEYSPAKKHKIYYKEGSGASS